jgi:hypothetical protein
LYQRRFGDSGDAENRITDVSLSHQFSFVGFMQAGIVVYGTWELMEYDTRNKKAVEGIKKLFDMDGAYTRDVWYNALVRENFIFTTIGLILDEYREMVQKKVGSYTVTLGTGECLNCHAKQRPNGEKLLRCRVCRVATYCGTECADKHWPTHKPQCKRAEDFEKLVPAEKGAPNCWTCGVEGEPLKKCTRCLTATYCSKACQTSDWPTHKSICNPPKPEASE